jgi:uncharacterized membrane protein
MDLRKSAGVFVVPELFSVPLIFVYNLNPKKKLQETTKFKIMTTKLLYGIEERKRN